MLLWMLYVIVVSLFLSGAALAAEHAERRRRGSTRWVWALGIVEIIWNQCLPNFTGAIEKWKAPQAPPIGASRPVQTLTSGRHMSRGPPRKGWLHAFRKFRTFHF
jgi:hypothetical protein